MTLRDLNERQYEGKHIVGYDCFPRVMFWMRKATNCGMPGASMRTQAINFIAKEEWEGKKSCNCCGMGAKRFSGPLKRCARCNAAWYCGKECQHKHWKAGHKVDCVQPSVAPIVRVQ